VRWIVNDASLQGQFPDSYVFVSCLTAILSARARLSRVRDSLYASRMLSERAVTEHMTFKAAILQAAERDIRHQILQWLDRQGPFFEDDRLFEQDDYFECFDTDVTDQGLGEAARRIKSGQDAGAFSFIGGPIDFARTPLFVDHGIQEERLGQYQVPNRWMIADLETWALTATPEPTSWRTVIEYSRERYPRLLLPSAIYENVRLAREPFASSIATRAIELFGHLHTYMESRLPDGSDSERSRALIRDFFTHAAGAEPLFSGESSTNQHDFQADLTFPDPEDSAKKVFAHWHGKIKHRCFRIHFVWPVPREAKSLKIVYFGPKLTKA
jgi:hypothetical protein